MMKQILKTNKLTTTLLNKFNQSNIFKANSAFFSSTNLVQRCMDLEKNDKLNEALKHKKFVS